MVTIRGMKATKEGKPAAVKVSFSVKKTGKTSKYSYASKVNVIDDKQAIVSAAATGVKTVTLTMVKDVASVASPVAISVKRSGAERAQKATANGKTITLDMDAKLTQGSYSVTITGLEDAPLTADFTVEKDETLTSFEVDDYLVAKSVSATTTGTIKFAALNQYNEKMTASDPTVTCTFGTVTNNNKPSKSATATAKGVITVEDINAVLAIPGTKGVVTLVGDMGVTATKEISYNTFAKATKAEVVGIYNKNSAQLVTLKEDDKIADHELLLKVTDQYDSVMSESDIEDSVRVTISGGLTRLSVDTNSLSTRTYNGEDYIAVQLGGADSSIVLKGEATLIVTCKYTGMLINDKITVSENVVIKSATITENNGVYYGQENVMNYDFVDQNGNSVTDYVTLVENCAVNFNGSPMRFERQDDGKAKLVLDLTNTTLHEPSQSNTDKASSPLIITCYANSQTGGDYLVKTFTFTMRQSRKAKGVTGVKAGVSTAISAKNTGKNLTIKSTDIVLADQYSNPLNSDEKAFNKTMVAYTDTSITSGTSVFIKQNSPAAFEVAVTDNKIIATPQAIVGTATVYLKYKYTTDTSVQSDPVASDSNYDAKFTLTASDTKGVDVSTLYIDSIYDGNDVTSKQAFDMASGNIVVKAKVGGVDTVIPADQYVITDKGAYNWSPEDDVKDLKTKTATLKVQVTTWDASNAPISTVLTKDYTVSRAKSKLFKVDSVVPADGKYAISGNGLTFSAGTPSAGNAYDFVKQFKFKDQYGAGPDLANAIAGQFGGLDVDCVTYKIVVLESYNKDSYEISHNDTNKAQIIVKGNAYCKFKVTVKAANGSTKSVTYVVNAGN